MKRSTKLPTERSFGFSIGGLCLGAAVFAWWRGRPMIGFILLVAGTLLIGLGLIVPAALHVPNRLWWRFAQTVGWLNARVVLTLFFAVVLTPVGVAMRLFGRNPLRAPHANTNWSLYPVRRGDPRHYEHLF